MTKRTHVKIRAPPIAVKIRTRLCAKKAIRLGIRDIRVQEIRGDLGGRTLHMNVSVRALPSETAKSLLIIQAHILLLNVLEHAIGRSAVVAKGAHAHSCIVEDVQKFARLLPAQAIDPVPAHFPLVLGICRKCFKNRSLHLLCVCRGLPIPTNAATPERVQRTHGTSAWRCPHTTQGHRPDGKRAHA
jgi:hypothetical protein